MVRARWQRMGTNTQMEERPQWCNEAAASKKQGMASQTKDATGQCIWGWVRSPLHCSTKACVFGFVKDPRKGSPMPPLTEFFDNVQLPTMPDVARDLVATMQDDDIPFEKVAEHLPPVADFVDVSVR